LIAREKGHFGGLFLWVFDEACDNEALAYTGAPEVP
jgi:hypothetical protein